MHNHMYGSRPCMAATTAHQQQLGEPRFGVLLGQAVLDSKLKANPSLAAKLRSMAVGAVWDTRSGCRSMASTLPGTSSCMHTQLQAEDFSSINVTNMQSIDAQQ